MAMENVIQQLPETWQRQSRGVAPRMTSVDVLLALAVIVSQLAVCNHVVISSFCSKLLYVVWGLLAVILICSQKKFLVNRYAITLLVVLSITFFQNKLFYYLEDYRTGGMGVARTLILCVAFYEVGLNSNKTQKSLLVVLGSYIFGVFLLMFFRRTSGVAMNSVDKNAIGAVSGAGLVCIIFLFFHSQLKQWQRFLLALAGTFIGITMIAMHTRTPVVALVGAMAGVFVLKHKLKKSILVGIILFILAIYLIPIFLENQLVWDYVQGIKSSNELTLDSISSKRITYWSHAWEDIKAHLWIGQGGWAYVDCFPLFVLRQGGLLSAILLFSITYGKFFLVLKKIRVQWMDLSDKWEIYEKYIAEFCSALVIYYTGISLFEGYVPFGPGVSTFFLWLVLGLFDACSFHRQVN